MTSWPELGTVRSGLRLVAAGLLRKWALLAVLLSVAFAPRALAGNLEAAPENYRVERLGWMELAYPASESGRVVPLKQSAEAARVELRKLLGADVLEHVVVRVAGSNEEMRGLAPTGRPYPAYASGVAYPDLDLVLLATRPKHPGEQFDLVQVFRHELVHIALHDAVFGAHAVESTSEGATASPPQGARLPRWFDEGLAVHASGELYFDRLESLATASLSGKILPLRELTYRFPEREADAGLAYAQAADLIRFLVRGDDAHRFASLLDRMRHGATFEGALKDAYSITLADLETEWKKDVASRYTFWPVLLGSSTLWVLFFGMLLWGYTRRRRAEHVKLARWAREEALEDARLALLKRALAGERALRLVVSSGSPAASDSPSEAASADAAAGGDSEAQGQEEGTPRPAMGLPRVEHEGHWHTLH